MKINRICWTHPDSHCSKKYILIKIDNILYNYNYLKIVLIMKYEDRKIKGIPIREYKRQWDKKNRTQINTRKRNKGRINKRKLVEYLGGKCMKCGYNKYLSILEFHHIRDKNFNINVKLGNGCALPFLKKEVDKCLLLCPNCHRELHYDEYIKKIHFQKVC